MSKLYLDIPYEHIEDLESYGCEFDEERENVFTMDIKKII